MQRTWQCCLGWDAPLPEDIYNDWTDFVNDLLNLLTIQVPRYINAPYYLLGSCDASQRRYAAVVYVRMIDVPTDKNVFPLGTKTKQVPLKQLTVPR